MRHKEAVRMLGRRALHLCWRQFRDAYDLPGRSLGLTPARILTRRTTAAESLTSTRRPASSSRA